MDRPQDVQPWLRSDTVRMNVLLVSSWSVARRAHWSFALGFTAVAALGNISASLIILLFGLLVAGASLLAAMAVLGCDPLNPFSVIRSAFRPVQWGELGIAVVGLVFALAVIRFSSELPILAARMANATEGDTDLMICALVCALAASVCAGIFLRKTLELRAFVSSSPEEQERAHHQDIAIAKLARGYWRGATELLTLAVIALVPAALLVNWAYNVLASVLLPLLVLSVRREHARLAPEGARHGDL